MEAVEHAGIAKRLSTDGNLTVSPNSSLSFIDFQSGSYKCRGHFLRSFSVPLGACPWLSTWEPQSVHNFTLPMPSVHHPFSCLESPPPCPWSGHFWLSFSFLLNITLTRLSHHRVWWQIVYHYFLFSGLSTVWLCSWWRWDGAMSILFIAMFLGPGTQLVPVSLCGMDRDGWMGTLPSLIPGSFWSQACTLGSWVRKVVEFLPSLFHCWGAVSSSGLFGVGVVKDQQGGSTSELLLIAATLGSSERSPRERELPEWVSHPASQPYSKWNTASCWNLNVF